ncbi:MAG: DUF1294 domain-containing protein [Prevotella sp.]
MKEVSDIIYRANLQDNMHQYSLLYMLAINVVTFFLYGIDKYKAKKGKWRISEATLLTLAAIGGSIGAWMGMRFWHHKTMHKKFKYGVPVIFILQVVLLIFLHTRIL